MAAVSISSVPGVAKRSAISIARPCSTKFVITILEEYHRPVLAVKHKISTFVPLTKSGSFPIMVDMENNHMPLTRAQQKVMDRLKLAYAVPYEQRNYGTFRFHGRGMSRTLAALKRMGLLNYDTINGHFGLGDYFIVWGGNQTPSEGSL